ncbi:hypothetical protein PV728_38440 [Streptomyces europaeiscabiei]|nr:hypothetical protein [Streptomyces europaeiscabiei]MDX3654094.1 hypothetical protein [Streptomyces europaeiscabiei]
MEQQPYPSLKRQQW